MTRRRQLAGWLAVVVGAPLCVLLSSAYHLQTALLNPVLPYFVGALIFLPPLQAGLAFLVLTSQSTYAQVMAPGAADWERGGRVVVVLAICVLIVHVKGHLVRRNAERLRLLAERGNARLQAVLDAAPEPMLVSDEQGCILRVNTLLETLSGYTREQIVGHSIETLVPPGQREIHIAARTAYAAAPQARPMGIGRELELVRANGAVIPIEVSLAPYHDGNGLLVVAGVVDIHIRREMERQRMNALLAAEEATMRAAAAEKRASERSAFMSAAAHELRTPLTALHGYAEIAQDGLGKIRHLIEAGGLPSEAGHSREWARFARSIPAIARQTVKIERLVGLLLDVARLEQGRVVLDIAPVDLAALVRETAQNAQVADPEHPINLSAVPADLPTHGDALRLEQVVANLLHNAQQYSPPGAAITVSLRLSGGGALLLVSDTGPGIPLSERVHVFERFYQIGRTERSQGLGLGLYLVRQFVQMHGGYVRIGDGPTGQGTTVSVWLPLAPPPPEASAP